jgi:hypothetical protein
MEKEIQTQLLELQNRYKKMKQLFILFFSLTIITIITLGFTKIDKFDVIRAKGIIIEDDKGKDRILIGAPIPYSKDRVRTDSTLVRKYFASDVAKDPNQYMEWYKKYRHTAFGMVVLNDKGIDVLQVGDQLSDPNVGRRIFLPTGMLLNNQKGMEVGGFGTHTFEDGKSGVALGLDDPGNGREAFHIVVMSDGTRALVIQDTNGKLVFGSAKPDNDIFKNRDSIPFVGAKYFDKNDNLLWQQRVNKTENLKK